MAVNNNKRQTYKLLQQVINEIDCSFTIDSVLDNGNGTYTLYSCDTAWLTKGFTIRINSVDYKIISFETDVSVTVSGASLPVAQTIDIYTPKFIQGTVLASVREFDAKKLDTDKLPLIWLHQLTTDKFDMDPNDTKDRESDCEIFFLIDVDFANWSTQEHCDLAIQPMRNLYSRFIDALNNSSIVKSLEDYSHTTQDIVNFGVDVSQKGEVKKIFNAYLSGVRLNITIPFLASDICAC